MKGRMMNKLYYQFPGTWFGDCMPFGKGDEFYLFHQRDTRRPVPFGEPFGWSLVTTKDFVHYQDHGVVLPPGGKDDQDQFIYAGSVCEAEGQYHIFYTGYNRDYSAKQLTSQVLMHATSTDLLHWHKTNDELTFKPQPGYDADDWRDPWIIWDPENKRYLLILGTRLQGPKTMQTGRTVQFSSQDLQHWNFEGDFWAPGMYTMHEMPDLFKIGDWWYHIVTEYSDRHGMTYRMSHSLKGPWIAKWDDAFDGSAYYAGRTFELNGKRVLFGWVGTKEHNADDGNYEWGGTFVPHQISQRDDGTLAAAPVDTLWSAFAEGECLPDRTLTGVYERSVQTLASECGSLFAFEADLSYDKETSSFGILINGNPKTGEAYRYIFNVSEQRVEFDGVPNYPWFTVMNIGLNRPIQLAPGRVCHLQVIVDDTIVTIYVNGVALTSRMYSHHGGTLGAFVTNGSIHLSHMELHRGLR